MTTPRFRLVATSKRSQSFSGGVGGTGDLQLSADKPLRIGRAADNDVRLPPDWIQISSRHCSITYLPGQDAWMVKDFSTNGTFINGQRIGRGKEAAARLGDKLQLSVIDPKAPDNHMEYVLKRADGSPEAATSAVQPSPGAVAAGPAAALLTPKRKQVSGASDNGGAAPATKRSKVVQSVTEGTPAPVKATPGGGAQPPASPGAVVGEGSGRGGAANGSGGGGDLQALFRLQENNQKLMKELDAARLRHEEAERRLKEELAGAKRREAAAQAEAASKVRGAEARARQAEDETAAMRARVASLQLEVEGANQKAATSAQQAAGAREAADRERSGREAAEGRVTALEARLAEAQRAQQEAVAAAAAGREELERLRGGVQAGERRAAELAARLEAVEAQAQLKQQELEALQAQADEERRGRQAAEAQLADATAAAEEAQHQIASLESRERMLQNDRLLVDGCLAALQRGNQRSQAANRRITEAFEELQRAKAEADAIMEEQCQQCSQIYAKLAASSGSRLLQPSPAAGLPGPTPQQLLLAGTQEVLPAGMLSPLGMMQLTAPAGHPGSPMVQHGDAPEQLLVGTDVAADGAAGAGHEQLDGREEAAGEGADDAAEDVAAEDEMEEGEDGQPEEAEEGQEVEMADVEDDWREPQPPAAGFGSPAAAAAAAQQAQGQAEQQQKEGSGAASTPMPPGSAPAESPQDAGAQEVVVVQDTEEEQEPGSSARVARAVAAAALAAASTEALREEGEADLAEEAAEEAAGDNDAASEDEESADDSAGAEQAISNGTDDEAEDEGPAAADADAGRAGQRAPAGGTSTAAAEEPAVEEGFGAGAAAPDYLGLATEWQQGAADAGAEGVEGAISEGQRAGQEAGREKEAAEQQGSEGAGPARSQENDASQGNVAGTQDNAPAGSLPSKVLESEPQQADDGAAAVGNSNWF